MLCCDSLFFRTRNRYVYTKYMPRNDSPHRFNRYRFNQLYSRTVSFMISLIRFNTSGLSELCINRTALTEFYNRTVSSIILLLSLKTPELSELCINRNLFPFHPEFEESDFDCYKALFYDCMHVWGSM